MGLLSNFGTSLTLLLAHLSLLRAHREHKVHNIVLYPDKESWCKTEPIKQVVTWPQCAPKELDNNVCVGACFSYMVPHSEPSAPGDLIRPYCDSCQPLDSIWHTVTLDCKDKDDNPTTMQKKVQIITNCSCSSCAESSRIKPDLNSLIASLAIPPVPVPQASPTAPHQEQQHQQQQIFEQLHQASAPTSLPPPMPTPTTTQSHPTSGAAPTAPGSSSASSSAETIEDPSSSSLAPQIVEHFNETSFEDPTTSSTTTNPSIINSYPSNETDIREAEFGARGGEGSDAPTQLSLPTSSSAASPNVVGEKMVEIAASESEMGRQSQETPDLLLNPNLNASRNYQQGEGAPNGPGAHERFLQLFKQINDPALGADKLAKLQSLQKLEKLEKLDQLNPSSQHHQNHENHEQLNRPNDDDEVNDNEEAGAGVVNPNDEDDQEIESEPQENSIETDAQVALEPEDDLQLNLSNSESTSTSTTLTPPPELPAIAPKDPDDEEVPSLQEGQLRVAAMLHRNGPHHSLVLDADDAVKEKIDVESHYLHPALAGQEISYHDNVLIDKSKKNEKDF
ncbi:hypothetical protein QAD02_022371 [Eretmocerus hayati]|uniref:Uncharacterized protein n=1 Tax=Eretmocerus hayati TaxID=131215 RepID=A0ACC2PW46_9HYME|nr:hypothetical protein QAD02_022371 [Eretmocerus hayati]